MFWNRNKKECYKNQGIKKPHKHDHHDCAGEVLPFSYRIRRTASKLYP